MVTDDPTCTMKSTSAGSMTAATTLPFAWLGGVLLGWHYLAAGSISVSAAAFLLSILGGWYFVGDLFVKFVLADHERFTSLIARLALGSILANVLLYLSALALPFGPAADWLLLFALSGTGWAFARRGAVAAALPRASAPEAIFLLFAPIAITLWCRELLAPVQSDGSVVVVRAWLDIFYHLCEIARFAGSRGIGTISDLHMAGVHSTPYHEASYIFSAALVDAASVTALVSYASLLVPLGLLVAALASYALTSTVFGGWPALAAGVALLLLPDAVQQGAGNPFFGYHWMLQIAPAYGYGLASAAITFMLLHEACRSGLYRLVLAGWFFVLFALLHKAQVFFAIAYLALVFPSLFFRGLSPSLRVVSGLLLTGIFWTVITASQSVPGVPVIRLDGTGLFAYSRLVLNNQAAGIPRQIFTALSGGGSWPGVAAAFAVLLAICTFGLQLPAYVVQLRRLRRSEAARVWLFPLLVAALYLVMATCLAQDDRRIGMPEELQHRPFVWAYYVMALWAAAAAYRRCFGDAPPRAAIARWSLCIGAAALLLVPFRFGEAIQTYRGWGFGYQKLPAGLVSAADFVRANSARGDLVQDSVNSTALVLSAFSERQPFALSDKGYREPEGLRVRMLALRQVLGLDDGRQVAAFMQQNSVRWLLIHPGDPAPWAKTLGSPPAYESDGFRVYRF